MADMKPTPISITKRSDDISKLLVDISYNEEQEFISKNKLQNGKHLMGRMIYLCSANHCKEQKKKNASKIVAKELHDDWISKNVYPFNERNIASKILNDYNTLQNYLKEFRHTNRKKTDAWDAKVNEFNKKMTKMTMM